MATAGSKTPAPLRVLVIDDEKNIRTTLAMCLESMGCEVAQAVNSEEALRQLRARNADVAFLDLKLGTEDGLALLPQLLNERPGVQVVMVTAFATVDTAVEAIKRGAQDYLPKPFTPAQIRHVVEQARTRMALTRRVHDLEDQLQHRPSDDNFETRSPKVRAVLDLVARAAASDVPVLLRGESGTGKSLMARAIHAQSARAAHPFVTINCPTLTEELLASELFGHARGAFTGALKDQPGRVEYADGGTLFLDEIGELPSALQAKLLRFVQDKEFERVGESKTRRADVRVIAATNRDLDADVKSGRFREDLLYRLNVVEVTVPSLRERPEDIAHLASAFLEQFARTAKRRTPSLAPETLEVLMRHPWPGNIRELRNAIERAVVLSQGDTITPQDLPSRMVGAAPASAAVGGNFTLEELEEQHIKGVVARAATQEEAARILGVDVSTLWRKKKKR